MTDYFPTVVQVIPQNDYTVFIYFDDGKIVLYDMSSKINKEIFKPLNDIEVFKNTCTVLNGTLAWDLNGNYDPRECIDIDVFTLYELPCVQEKIA